MARFNNTDIGRAWASGKYERGKGSNIFFEGDTIYSYGYHFKIARKVGEGVYLFNARGYSPTTSKQQTQVRRGLSGKVFTVVSLEPDHKENIIYYIQELMKRLNDAHRSRKFKDSHFERSETLYKELLDYIDFFKVRLLMAEKDLLGAISEECIIQPDLNGERLKMDFFNAYYERCKKAWDRRLRRRAS